MGSITSLCELAHKYDTDKRPGSGKHNYTPFYHYLLHDKKVSKVLEIGADQGKSLRMWQEFFPSAQIWGIDKDPDKLVTEDRIKTLLCDQSSEEQLLETLKILGSDFDFICDDGSHNPDDQVLSAKILAPALKSGGYYIIEDVYERTEVLCSITDIFKNGYSVSQIETAELSKGSDNRLVIIYKY